MQTTAQIRSWAALQCRTAALETAVETLSRGGVQVLPVKGILLVHEIYDDPVERPLSDVDMLIRPRDFRRALRIARGAGWRMIWDSKMLGNVNFLIGGIAMDTACSVGPPGTCAIGVGEMMKRARVTVEPLGFRHLQIDWHDHLLLMVVDVFKDKLGAKPAAREDLVRMASSSHFDLARMLDRARRAKLETVLAIVADWVLNAGACKPWSDMVARLETGGRRSLYRRAFPWLARRAPPPQRSIPLGLLARAASDSRARQMFALALGAAGTARFMLRHGSLTFPGSSEG